MFNLLLPDVLNSIAFGEVLRLCRLLFVSEQLVDEDESRASVE